MGAMDLIYNIARRAVPVAEEAQDLVQETYLAAFRAWQDERRPRKVEPWLATICLNLARSMHRRRAVRPREVPLHEVWTGGAVNPEDEVIAELDRAALRRAMWLLPEEQRTALTLVDLAGFSTREAASIMNTPRGTVLSRLHRGRRALAALLGQDVRELDQ